MRTMYSFALELNAAELCYVVGEGEGGRGAERRQLNKS